MLVDHFEAVHEENMKKTKRLIPYLSASIEDKGPTMDVMPGPRMLFPESLAIDKWMLPGTRRGGIGTIPWTDGRSAPQAYSLLQVATNSGPMPTSGSSWAGLGFESG